MAGCSINGTLVSPGLASVFISGIISLDDTLAIAGGGIAVQSTNSMTFNGTGLLLGTIQMRIKLADLAVLNINCGFGGSITSFAPVAHRVQIGGGGFIRQGASIGLFVVDCRYRWIE